MLREFIDSRPVWIYDVSRDGISHNQRKAKELLDLYV
jgi:hypothetical protein